MLTQEVKKNARSSVAGSAPAYPVEAGDLKSNLNAIVNDVLEAADAQLSIYSLKTTRILVIAAFGVIAAGALGIFAIYACFLLDSSVAIALSQTTLPAWSNPLIRGLVYAGISGGLLFKIWNTMVGSESE